MNLQHDDREYETVWYAVKCVIGVGVVLLGAYALGLLARMLP